MCTLGPDVVMFFGSASVTLRDWEAFHELKATIDNFLETLPLLTGLACPFMQPRHWETISKLAGVELSDKIPDFRVRNITEAKLYRFFDDVEEITNGAVREADIEEKINKVYCRRLVKIQWSPAARR